MKVIKWETSKDLVDYYNQRFTQGYVDEFTCKDDYEFKRSKRLVSLLTKVPLENQSQVLDYGCGTGRYVGVLRSAFPNVSFSINGCDISGVAIDKAKIKYLDCEFVRFDEVSPYPDGVFDLVLSVEVFEHVGYINKTIKDIARILKPNGYLVFSTPCANHYSLEYIQCLIKKNGLEPTNDGYRRFYFENLGHLRRLTSKEITELLEGNGLIPISFQYFDQFWGALRWMYGDKLRPLVRNLKNYKGVKKLVRICLLPFYPSVYFLDFMAWLEWRFLKWLPNGSGIFGVFIKRE